MRSKLEPAIGANMSPRMARTRTRLSHAFSLVFSTARREMSVATTSRAPDKAAATAMAPLPVKTSSTDAPAARPRRSIASISSRQSLGGRRTPGSTTVRMLLTVS